MWIKSDHRGVRIFVRGEFVAPRQWLIQATVTGGLGTDTAKAAASRQRTLSELWQGIVFESRVGRHLGAVAIRVVVDGDREIASVFAATGYPERSPGPASSRDSDIEGPGSSIAPRGEGESAPSPEHARQQGASAG
jgi:hypothetical protein